MLASDNLGKARVRPQDGRQIKMTANWSSQGLWDEILPREGAEGEREIYILYTYTTEEYIIQIHIHYPNWRAPKIR